MKALVLGGTGFMGRRLVAHLLDSGAEVTVGSSGKTKNPFGERASAVVLDRFDPDSLDAVAKGTDFDVLFDQIGFGPDDVSKVVKAFQGRVGHYVFTSSGAVYRTFGKAGHPYASESDFEASTAEIMEGGMGELGYAEGKRSAEAYLAKNSPFPFAAARFPIVVGPDDVTGRLQFHVDRVQKGEEIFVPSPCGRRNFLWVDDAGRFLVWLGANRKTGAYNAASERLIDAVEVSERVGGILMKAPRVTRSGAKEEQSPYYIEADSGLDASKASKEGFPFTPFDSWFPGVVRDAAGPAGKSPNSMDYFWKRAVRDR